MPLPFYHPKPAPAGVRHEKVIPEVKANPLSLITFSWIFPLLKTGFSRPLEIEDIWHLDDARLTKEISDRLERNFFERCPPEVRPVSLGGVGYGKGRKIQATRDDALPERSSVASTFVGPSTSTEEEPKRTGAVNEKERELADDVHAEEAEQSILADLQPEELAVDLPVADRTLGLGINSQGNQSKEHVDVESRDEQKDVQTKQAQLKKSINPYTNYRRAKKLAKGKLAISSVDGKPYDQSLTAALHTTYRNKLWLAAACQICSGVLQSTSSLVTKKLITYITEAHAWHVATEAERALMNAPRSVGYGIGVAFGLAIMQEAASLFSNQFFVQAMGVGWMARASLIDQISRKSLRLSGKARLEMTNGRLTTSVSGDCSFMDFAAPMAVECFTQPITIAIGMALLIYNLGYSALVGLAVLVASTPLLALLFSRMIGSRQAQMKIVDQRVRLLSEVMNNIRAIKLYAYESFFGKKLSDYRQRELARLRFNVRNRATMISTMTFMPILAAVLTFITYGLSGHTLNAATIFAGLQLFNIISGPMRILPLAFTAVSDAHVAVTRIGKLLLSDELPQDLKVDPAAKYAIRAEGDFTFETSKPPDVKGGERSFGKDRHALAAKKKAKKENKIRAKKGLPPLEDENKKKEDDGVPFQLRNIDVKIPRGSLVCVVGRIGSGKSALLQALIGEMRATRGEVVFGGPLSYFQQTPWVQNCSLRDNIVFGEEEVDEAKLEIAIEASALQSDIDILGDGLETEIGERGINLSGGQKARVCLARCVYFDAEVVLLDDPLAAVDSHVAHHLLEKCILGALADKTRVLITHHLEVLPHADYILVLEDGAITQQGTFDELRRAGGTFTQLMDEYGTEKAVNEESAESDEKPKEAAKQDGKKEGSGVKVMQDEERNTGSVDWSVYIAYAKAMGANGWLFLAAALLILAQCSQVGNTLFLGFWSGGAIEGFRQGDYMAIYASFGVAQALLTFGASYTISLAGLRASFLLFNRALKGVLGSPILFFDSTPIGRIISRLSKDIEMIDDRLTFQWYQFLSNSLSVLGTVALVIYTYTWLGLIFIPLSILYYVFAEFYRKTSREVKRIDSNTRSFIYSSFGEQLTGMASIRAYRQQERFKSKLQRAVDVECRAYYSTIVLQRWLGVRLDLLGNILVLGIGVFGVAFRNSVSPSKLGVVLTYSLQATQVFSQLVNIFAQVEQEMNNVERVTYYGNLPQEAPATKPNDPPPDWPQRGHLQFNNVQFRYREGLPLVLKGVTFEVMPGEKIGIVGRTGAGKSSLAQALFRIVELAGGNIAIDGVDIREIGLDTLRTRLSAIPQDALLYGGTMRDNLDPTGAVTDAELHDALRRCDLVPPPNAPPHELARFEKFKLDAIVSDDGSNFSGGERQLVALARAVVKNSRVCLLDEATSSVDPETDASIQRTIRKEFTTQTLLCIAHRLATIAFYDRILVLELGEVKEFDTPLNLFDRKESIFRSMCDAAQLTRDQIIKIRDDNATPLATLPTTPAQFSGEEGRPDVD